MKIVTQEVVKLEGFFVAPGAHNDMRSTSHVIMRSWWHHVMI